MDSTLTLAARSRKQAGSATAAATPASVAPVAAAAAPIAPVAHRGEWRPVLALSLQLTLAQLAPVLLSLYLAGLIVRRDELVFSSYSLVSAVNLTLFIAASSFLQVLYYLGGRARGREDAADYGAMMRAGVAVALGAGLVASLVSVGIGPALALLRFDPGLVAHARGQGLAAAVGLLPMLLLVVFRVHAALSGSAGLVGALASGGAVAAAVLASAVALQTHDADLLSRQLLLVAAGANWTMLALAAWALRRLPALQLVPTPNAVRAALAQMWQVGWPIGAVVLLDNLCMLSSNLAMGRFFVDALAVHAVVLLWVTLGLLVPLGIAQAAVQRVAVSHAQGELAQRNAAARAALGLGAVWGLAVLVAFATLAVPLGGLFMSAAALDPNARALLRAFMPWGGVVLALQGLIVIGAAVLRGIGQTRAPLIQAAIGYLVFGSGGQALFALGLGHGAVGLWWGLVLGFALTACAVLWRCHTQLRLAPPAPAAAGNP